MTDFNINTETILPGVSEQENRVMVSILDNLRENFEVAQSQGKLREFMQEYAVGILSINQRAGLLPDVKFESEYSSEY